MESTSLVKALGLLEATAADPAGRSLAVLAAEVGLAKPTAHRILKSLTSLGYLERGSLGVYRQTTQVHRLVSNDRTGRLLAAAEPLLRKLHETTRETVNLGVLRNDRVVYLQVLESPQPLRRVVTPNSVDPFHSTALGRAIVSHLSSEQQVELLRRTRFEPRTPHTNVNADSLMKVLRQAAIDGYALEVDETDLGVTCIGAPVLDAGVAVAAISLSVPTVRATGEMLPKLVALVRQSARQIAVDFATPTAFTSSKRSSRSARIKPESMP